MDAIQTHSEKPRLLATGISKRFGATIALKSVDLDVKKGEVLSIVGENGAGKSTLMKILSGAHKPDSGSIRLDEQDFMPRSPLEARRDGIAMIYQELTLANHLSVMENILLANEPTLGPLVNWSEMKRIAQSALQEVGIAEIPLTTLVKNLSIGQQQLVEIARAVALECKVLILDEPTSSLTRSGIEKLFSLIKKLKAKDISIIYISHFLEEVQEISDRITVLRDGETVGTKVNENVTADKIVEMMVGREVDELYPRTKKEAVGDIVLSCHSLQGIKLPKKATFELRRGQVYGIAGLVGAGRTELLRAIFGLDSVSSGQIKIGANSDYAGPRQRWDQGIGMVSENRKLEGLALNLSIADNMTLPSLKKLGSFGFVWPRSQLNQSKELIAKFSVKCRNAWQNVGDLSGGNQQKVAIARLLHADVDVLLLDEPTKGIDVGSKAQIYSLINELACGAKTGIQSKAILVVSSYLPELLGICDQIAVMERGNLSNFLPVDEWSEQRLMRVATGQEEA